MTLINKSIAFQCQSINFLPIYALLIAAVVVVVVAVVVSAVAPVVATVVGAVAEVNKPLAFILTIIFIIWITQAEAVQNAQKNFILHEIKLIS